MKKIINFILSLFLTFGLLGCSNSSTSSTVSLDSIAKLNNVEPSSLNTVYDDNGYLTFLSGGKFADTKITNEEEALSFLTEKMSDLLSLDGINLEYDDEYKSPNTEVTYYRFQQTLNGDFNGEENITLKYLVNSIKLGVDADGYPVVLSSDLDHSELEYSADNLITTEEANEVVRAILPNVNVYDDYTGLIVWNDGT